MIGLLLVSQYGVTEGQNVYVSARSIDDYQISIESEKSEIKNIRAIIKGEQSMTVFKDTRELAMRTFQMIDDILLGKATLINDNTSYHNGFGIIPTYICKPVMVDISNYRSLLIDTEYHSAFDLEQE